MKKLFLAFALFPFSPYANNIESGEWNYSEKKDEMRNEFQYSAYIYTDNMITTSSLGGEPVLLVISKKAKKEYIAFAIHKGVFDCASCKIAIKIDDDEITHLKAERGDGYDTLFITNKKQLLEFVKNMKKGKKMIVELPIYRYGKQQAKFEIRELKWDHF